MSTNHMNVTWPPLELTAFEAEYANRYFGGDKPGVYRRMYPVQFVRSTMPGEVDTLRGRLATSGRRARIFATTFSGMIWGFALKVSLLSGEQILTDAMPVSALLNLQSNATAGFPPELAAGQSVVLLNQNPGRPLLWDPNIVLEGAQELVLETLFMPAMPENSRFVLNTVWHVWEFPETLPSRNESAARIARKGKV